MTPFFCSKRIDLGKTLMTGLKLYMLIQGQKVLAQPLQKPNGK